MRRSPLLLFAFALGLTGSAISSGCDGDDDEAPVTERACERFDECNFLEAGVAVADCYDSLDMCVGDLVTSQRQDWEREMETCLQNANCNNFGECYLMVPHC